MSSNNLSKGFAALYNLGVTPDNKKGALTQNEIDQAELIFWQMINYRPVSLRIGLDNPNISHKLLQLFAHQNDRRVQQLTMALGNAIGKKHRAEKTDFVMAVQNKAREFPHLSNKTGVQKMIFHLMARSCESAAA